MRMNKEECRMKKFKSPFATPARLQDFLDSSFLTSAVTHHSSLRLGRIALHLLQQFLDG